MSDKTCSKCGQKLKNSDNEKTSIALFKMQIYVLCLRCKERINLFDINHDYYYNKILFHAWDDFEGIGISCPICLTDITISKIEYSE